jgi:hypothetical protein
MFKVSVGQAFSVEGREAVSQAIYDALLNIENEPVALAFIIASFEYDFQDILNGAVTQLGNAPLIGFSTSGEMTSEGCHRRSVVVALIAGEEIKSRAEWLPNFSEDSQHVVQQMSKALDIESSQGGALFLVPDGLVGDYEVLLNSLPGGEYTFAGCLAGGDLHRGRTFQIGGDKVGAGGLAGAFLSGGNIRLGVGAAHGWQPVGASFKITMARGPWIRALDGKPASESYAHLFGRRVRDWAFPPLNTLVRLYPLGIERDGDRPLMVRTPIRVEADGSLRMSATIQDGSVGHLLVGGTDSCLEAARTAAKDALNALGSATPKMALVFADISWQMLLTSRMGSEVEAVREVLGDDIPIAGGYTFGQLVHLNGASSPEFLNQHIEVVVIGEGE